jgi:hypothetical protein
MFRMMPANGSPAKPSGLTSVQGPLDADLIAASFLGPI